MTTTTAQSHPNIAFIKYWGNRDDFLRLPVNGSISMNLEALETCTTVTWNKDQKSDTLTLNGTSSYGPALQRVSAFLNLVREIVGFDDRAEVISTNNFPMGAGIASSASAFAALALAATHAAGITLEESALSRLARRGSGSACRSIPGGFVEWSLGETDIDSFAFSIAPVNHWDLVDCIVIIDQEHKATGSTRGNALAMTSPLQSARVADAPRRLSICREAIHKRDFLEFAGIVELDSNLMHAVMMTSTPPLFYWHPVTLTIMEIIRIARRKGLAACATVDAGPNVHVICERGSSAPTIELIKGIPGVIEIRTSGVGGATHLLE